jgi:hypothetical protein
LRRLWEAANPQILNRRAQSQRTINRLKALTHRDFKSYFVRVIVPAGGDNFVLLFPVEFLQALPQK